MWPFCPPGFLPDRSRKLDTRTGFLSPSLDGDLLNAKADAFIELAEANAVMAASQAMPANQRPVRWQTARRLYQQSLDILLDMKNRGTLSSTEDSTIAEVQRGLARCAAALKQ